MLVAHAIWLDDRLAIWAEDSSAPAEPPRRPGRRPRRAPHPFAAGHDTLQEALDSLVAKAATDWRTLHLPAVGVAPVASPELVRDPPGDREVTLREFHVPTLEYEADEAPGVLLDLSGGPVTLGTTARHLLEVAAFAADLVARGRLLPTVDPAGPRAVWRPVLTGADAQWAQALALALPPAGRAADPQQSAAAGAAAPPSTPWWTYRASQPRTRAPGPASASHPGDHLATRPHRRGPDLRRPRRRSPDSRPTWPPGSATRSAAPCAPASGSSEPSPRRGRRLAPRASRCRPPTSRASSSAADQVWRGPARRLCPGRALGRPRRPSWPSSAGPAGCTRRWTTALRTARPAALPLDTAGAHRFLTRRRAAAGRPPGSGCCCRAGGRKPAGPARRQADRRAAAPSPGTVGTAAGVGLGAVVDFRVASWRSATNRSPTTSWPRSPSSRRRWCGCAGSGSARPAAARGRPAAHAPQAGDGRDDRRRAAPPRPPATTRARRPAGDRGRPPTGWLGDLLAGDADGGCAGRRAAGLRRHPAAVPGARPGLAELPGADRARRRARRRHGPGQDGAAAGAAAPTTPADAGPTLLVCPMSLVGNWQREAARFTPDLRVHVHHGAERARGAGLRRPRWPAPTWSSPRTRSPPATRRRCARSPWHRVVVDEAQAIKNAATSRRPRSARCRPAHRIAVTGTPVENRLADLWSILEFANPGLLGHAPRRSRSGTPSRSSGTATTSGRGRLRRLTGPFVLRRLKTDRSIISDLPEKLEMEVLLQPHRRAGRALPGRRRRHAGNASSAATGIERRGLVLATMTKLKQVCNHPAHLLRDGSRAGRALRQAGAAGGDPRRGARRPASGRCCSPSTRSSAAMLRGHLSARFGREVAYLHGGVAEAGARRAGGPLPVAATPAAPPLFVLSLKAGGTGLTLTAANHVVHVDRWWNPAVEDQATDRAFRIGQRRAVQVRKFVCAGTRRGEDRRHDRREARAGRARSSAPARGG